MKKEWDKRAEENPFHYVSAFRREWDEDSFYEWGENQTQMVIDGFLRENRRNPSEMVVMEIGCGAGRMTRAFASRFKYVYAFDISENYIEIAREKNRHLSNVSFVVNNGLSFSDVADRSIDFAFSGWTMRHMPTKEVITSNIEDMARTLKIGGLYKIDPPIATRARLLKSRLIRHVPWIIKTILRQDELKTSSTWVGASFSESEVRDVLSQNGLDFHVTIEDDGSASLTGKRAMQRWFYGQRIR